MNKHTAWKISVAFVTVLLGISCWSASRTLNITKATPTSVSFAFGGDALACKLFVATGATDGDDDKCAWTTFEQATEIAAGQSTYTYEIPAAYRDGRYLRFFLMQTSGINMASELKSVSSTGKQQVNTGIAHTSRTCMDFRFGNFTSTGTATLFGRGYNNSQYLFIHQGGNFQMWGFGTNIAAPNSKLDYQLLIDDNDVVTLISSDGVKVQKTDAQPRVGSGNDIAVFACNNGGYKSAFTFYRMKISLAGNSGMTLQGDFVPAKNASGTAGLYNNVTDTFIASKSGTALTAGEAIPSDRFGRVLDMTPTFVTTASSSSAYIQNGLKAHFDGIHNVGYGVHSAKASVWKDLTGNGYDAALVSVNPTWGEKGWTNASDGKPFALPLTFSTLMNTAVFSVDFSVKPSRTNERECFLSQYNNAGFGMEHNGSGSESKTGYFRFYYNGNPNLLTYGSVVSLADSADNFIYTAQSGSHVLYKNGAQGWTASNAIGTPPETGKQFYVGGDTRANMAFKGEWYSLRVYDRVLTADEAAINSAIDQVRYFGKTVAEVNASVMPTARGWSLTDDVLLRRQRSDLSIGAKDILEEDSIDFTNTTGTATLNFTSLATAGTTRTLAGELIVRGPLQIVVPSGLAAGDYTLLEAKEIVCEQGGSITLAAECAAGHAIEVTGTKIFLHVTETKPSRAVWTGAAGNGDLDDAQNWSCVDQSGAVLSDAKPEADLTSVCLTGDTSFNCPVGTTPRWNSILFSPLAGAPKAQFGYFKRGYETKAWVGYKTEAEHYKTCAQYDTEFVNLPEGYLNYVGDIAVPGDLSDETWKANYLATSTVRADGWVFVTAAQAGSWVATIQTDDYSAFAMDGVWLVKNKASTSATGESYDVTAGWHRYTILLGDTYGSCGFTQLKVAINGTDQIDFNGVNFQFGAGENKVRLTTDCDWRGLGTLNLPAGLTLDLNGHNLTIAGAKGTLKGGVTITGAGTVTVDGGTFDDNGITLASSATRVFTNCAVVTATWTGNGDRSDLSDPANWTCCDADGHVVAGGVPAANTVVTLSATTSFQIPAGETLTAAYIQPAADTLTLGADVDWRGAFAPAALPAAFDGTRLSHLDAPKGAYINTGVKPTGSYRLAMDVTVQSPYEYWFDAWYSTNLQDTRFGLQNNGETVFVAYGNQNHDEGSAVPNGRHLIELNRENYVLDGVLKVNRLHSSFAAIRNPLYLFACNKAGTAETHAEQGTIRFHGCRIYDDNGTLVRDYVPVRKTDGSVGAYDFANNVFYGNNGTGTFEAGVAAYMKSQSTFVPPVPVDLAGHTLDLAPTADASACTVDDTSTGARGTLRLHITTEQTFVNTTFTLSGNLHVVIDAPDATFELGTKLVDLSDKPTGVTFAWAQAHDVDLVVSDHGVFYGADPTSPVAVKAHWTGAAGDGDPTNPENWCATNLYGNAVAEPTVNAETDVYFHNDATVKVPATGFTWKQMILGDGKVLTLDATAWTGNAGDALVTTVLGITPTEGVVSRVCVVNPRLNLALSEDGKVLTVLPSLPIAWHHLKVGKNWSVTTDCAFRLMPLEDYTTRASSTNEFSFMLSLNGESGNTWINTYLKQSQNRIDGWFEVTNEQVGDWTVSQLFDDFMAVAIDGDWKILNPTYTKGESATFAMAAGWHQFTVVFGDTSGGYGNYSGKTSSLMVTLPGQGNEVPFDERTFTVADPTASMMGNFAITQTGEVPCATFDVAAGCRLVLDPAETQLKLLRAPTFAPGAKIALAAKYAAANEGLYTLMTWKEGTVCSYGVELTDLFDATSVASGVSPIVQEVTNADGSRSLVLSVNGAVDVVTAYWTGAEDGDPAKAANWDCRNLANKTVVGGVPSSKTAVFVGGTCNLSVPSGTTLPYATFKLSSDITFGADTDWRGLNFATVDMAGHKIDVNGHAFSLASGADLTAGTITSGVAGGSLHIDVADNTTVANTGLALTGTLQLVKDGAGTFIAQCRNQSYTGGTTVTGGILTSPLSPDNNAAYWSPWGSFIFGARGTTLTVQAGATLDMNGNYDYRGFNIVLAGGTLRASGRDMANDTWGCAGGLTLTADSTYVIDATIVHNGDGLMFDLGGHTLTVQIANGKYWKPKACTFADNGGKVVVTGSDGRFWNYGDIAAPTVDWDFGCKLEVKNNLTVHDFTCRYAEAWGYSKSDKKVSVYGTFKPVSDFFCNVEMQNGSTLDLSVKEGAWSMTSEDTAQEDPNKGKNFLTTFAAGATVTVDLGTRRIKNGTRVVAWETAPNATFKLPDGVKGELKIEDDGLYLFKHGMTIFVK